MAGYWGYVSQLGIGTTSTVDQRLDYLSESLACQEEFPDTGGLRGTRSHAVERVRAGIRRVAGTITLQPTAVELSYLLPWILGANASGTTYALADALQSRYVSVDRGAKVFLYDAVWVDSATFRATQGSPLSVTLNLVGSDETVNNAGTFPSLTLDTTTNANAPLDSVVFLRRNDIILLIVLHTEFLVNIGVFGILVYFSPKTLFRNSCILRGLSFASSKRTLSSSS
jgi:hypothetical protein